MNKSATLFQRAKNVIPGGVNSPVRAFRNVDGDPFFVQSAKGSRICDADGRELIDYVGTWGPAILGHAPRCVIDEVHRAVDRGLGYGTPTPVEVEMAETIVRWLPSVQKVRMVNSGTEATMSAVRLARGYTGRKLIVKFQGCYHGHVDSLLVAAGSGALTFGEPDSAGVPPELAKLTLALPFNDKEAVRQAFAQYGRDIAAVILEPFPANAGLYLPRDGFLEFLREITREHDSLLIFDEVMTGFRVAKGGVQELYGITPDLTCMGKIIGGGLPVGAFGGRADIMGHLSPLGPVYQAGTLSGNPVAMAAGLAQLRELETSDAYARLEANGAQLENGIRESMKAVGKNFTFHRAGSMFCLFFTEQEVNNLDQAMSSDRQLFKSFFWHMLGEGIYIAPSPYETGFISTAHSAEDIDATCRAADRFFRQNW